MKQQGFTLIELIVVIVVLGILAATALPKFSNLSADARLAKMQSLAGSLKGAVAMAHGEILSEALPESSAVTLEGGVLIAMSSYYPDASTSGIGNAFDMTGFVSVVNNGISITFYPDQNHANIGTCAISYIPANYPAILPASTVPIIDTTGASTVTSCM